VTDEQKQEVMRRQYEQARAMSKEAMDAMAAAQYSGMRCISSEELVKRHMEAMQNMHSLYATQSDCAVRADEPKTMIGRILKRLQFI